MSATDHQISHPKDLFFQNNMTMGANPNLEKQALAPVDFQNRPNMIFNNVSGAATGQMIQPHRVDPNGPEHQRSMTISPDLMQRCDMTQAMLQDKNYANLKTHQSDVGQLGASCGQAMSELFGALGPSQPQATMAADLTYKPSMFA